MESKKAAVFIILGQSNAVGHRVPMQEQDLILSPMKNVFGLHRKDNQSFDITQLVWSGYTSGGVNLAEEQDHTYSIPNCLALLWQRHIDAGNARKLPDLYIIQIAIGAQGVNKNKMWYPDREKKLIPGKLGVVDISLFPFTNRIFSLLDDSFAKMGKEYEIIGLHWRGGESDRIQSTEYLHQNLKDIYTRIFDSFNKLLHNPPMVLHKLVCYDRARAEEPAQERVEHLDFINRVFYDFQQERPNFTVLDPADSPLWVPDQRGNGVFMEDMIHFTPELNMWVAESIFDQYHS